MPSLKTEVATYVKRVVDSLRTGPGYSSASLSLGSGTSELKISAVDPGAGGNDISVEVTSPGGIAALAISVTAKKVTIALSVNVGVPVTADNTALKICNAINASSTASALVEATVTGSGAGSLASAVAEANLTGGVTGTDSLPLNFLRAQDMASVLELLQSALDQPATLTATGGTTRSVQDTGAFVAGSQIGNIVKFAAGTTTTALQGKEYRVVSNTANELFFASGALDGTPVSGDTYTIIGGMADSVIAELIDGRSLADAPAAHLYGDSRLVTDVLVRMIRQLGATVTDKSMWSGDTAAGSTTTEVKLDLRGGTLRIDQFRGLKLAVTGFPARKIVSSTADGTVTVSPALASAPAGSTATTVSVAQDSTDASRNLTFAPGGQPGDNRLLAQLMTEAKKAVVAFTLPV